MSICILLVQTTTNPYAKVICRRNELASSMVQTVCGCDVLELPVQGMLCNGCFNHRVVAYKSG